MRCYQIIIVVVVLYKFFHLKDARQDDYSITDLLKRSINDNKRFVLRYAPWLKSIYTVFQSIAGRLKTLKESKILLFKKNCKNMQFHHFLNNKLKNI